MRRSIASLLAVLCVGLLPDTAAAASGEAQWTRVDKTFRRASAGRDVATYVTDVYMAGDGDVEPCYDDNDVHQCARVSFVRRYTGPGVRLWSRSFNLAPNPAGAPDNYLRTTTMAGIAVDASGVYVTGRITTPDPAGWCYGNEPSEVFVRKYTHTGSHVWTRRFGTEVTVTEYGCPTSARVAGTGIAVDASGVYVTGNTEGSLPGYQNVGRSDAFLRKYTTAGALVWTRQAGTRTEDTARDVALSPWGVFITGVTAGAWPGGTNQPEDEDAFVLRYTRSGSLTWTRQFGSVAADSATSIATAGSVFYVAGGTEGTFPGQTNHGSSDAWVRKFRGDGTLLWTRQFGTRNGESVLGLDADAAGVFLTGGTSGSFPGYTRGDFGDVYVTSYSSAGSRGWTRQFGSVTHSGGWDSGHGIAIGTSPGDTQQDDRQGVYVTGEWGIESSESHYAFLRKHER